jgi:5'-deoxynucleotidase YfbR-like HD superfamily hydrolase
MTNDLDLESLYSSMRVSRWHTHAACVKQDVGQHTIGMLAVLEKFHPSPSANLMRAILYHDAAEIKTGDFPHEMKEEFQELRAIEEFATAQYFAEKSFPEIELTAEEKLWLKFCDNYEVFVFLSQEVLNGNYLTGALREIMNKALARANDIAIQLKAYGWFTEANEEMVN